MGTRPRLPVGQKECACAAVGGHLEVLRWARAHGCEWDAAHVRARAAQDAHGEVLRWLDDQGE